jgi:tRNA(Ile)-lysidine synthase
LNRQVTEHWELEVLAGMEDLIPGIRSYSLLVALSGGMDSVALLRILIKNGFQVKVAHVNYGLRGEESDADEAFCEALCAELRVPFFVHRSGSEPFKPGLSVQAVAREIRYSWFEALCHQEHCDFVLTGHHRDDQAETIIMQALRRKAFKMYQPIARRNGNVVRPLLGVTRQEILQWMQQGGYAWREDSSNAEDIYLRNQVRNRLIPELLKIQPSLSDHMEERVVLYQAQYNLVERAILPHLTEIMEGEAEQQVLLLNNIVHLFGQDASAVLAYLLDRLGEPASVANQVIRLMASDTGKKVMGLKGIYYRDRDRIIHNPYQDMPQEVWILPGVSEVNYGNWKLSIREFRPSGNFIPEKTSDVLVMDASRLKWPLRIRPWAAGDKMKPLGMEGSRKVSDILTGLKLSPPVRESAFVISSDEKIIFVQGYRIANKVRYRKDTRRVLEIRITQKG